jgi:hypothetical protein
MTYTAVNPHVCCHGPRQNTHADDHLTQHHHVSTHLTNNNRLCWKTNVQPRANGPPTTETQQRLHLASTPARGQPRPDTPSPSPQRQPPSSQSQGQVPVTEQNFSGRRGWCEELVGQERLGPSYFLISLVLGPLNSLLWYVPS